MNADRSILPPGDAAFLLAEVDRVRRHTRSTVGQHTWRWFLVWAVVFTGAALIGPRSVWYWPVAVSAALVITAVMDMRLTWSRTARRAEAPYWAIGGLITVLCFGGGWVLPVPVAVIWVWMVLGLGFAGFALLEHHRKGAAALTIASLLALLVGVTIPDPGVVYRLLGGLFAAVTAWLAWRMRP